MPKKSTQILLIPLVLILVGLTLFAVGVIPVNLFFARSLLSELSVRHTGLDLHIAAPLQLRLGSIARLSGGVIELRRPDHPQRPLLRIQGLELSANLRQLLQGDIHITEIIASGVKLDYCQPWPAPPGNDVTLEPAAMQPPSLVIDQMRITELAPVCEDPGQRVDFLPQALTLSLAAAQDTPLEIHISGESSAAANPIVLQAVGGPLVKLLHNPAHYPLRATLEAAGLKLTIDGELRRPLTSPALDTTVAASVENMRDLMASLGRDFADLDAPDLGALDLRSQLVASKSEVRLTQAQLTLADISLAGDLLLNLQPDCPQLSSSFKTEQLELALFNRFLGNGARIGGQLGSLAVASSSCGNGLDEHIETLQLSANLADGEFIGQGGDVLFSSGSLSLDIAPGLASVLHFDGQVLGETLAGTATFGAIAQLRSDTPWPLTVEANGAELRLDLTADTAVREGQLSLDGQLDIGIDRLGALHNWIGIRPDNQLPGKLSTGVSYSPESVSLAGFKATLGNSHMIGSFSRAMFEGRPLARVNIEAKFLDLDELDTLFAQPATKTEATRGSSPGQITGADIQQIEDWFSFPDVDFELAVNRAVGYDFEARNLVTKGQLRDHLIDSARLGLLYEGIDFNGLLNVDLRTQPWSLAYTMDATNIDIGSVLARLHLAEHVTARAEQLRFELTSQGLSIRRLLANADFTCRLQSLSWSQRINTGTQESDKLSLDYLQLEGAPSSPTQWSGEGAYNDVDIRLRLQSPSLGDLLSTQRDLPLPLQLTLASGQDVAIIDALLDRSDTRRLAVQLDMSGERMQGENFLLEELQPPLGAYRVQGKIIATTGELLLSDLDVSVGRTLINGEGNIRRHAAGYNFHARLHSPVTDTEDFVALAALGRASEDSDIPAGEPGRAQDKEGFLTMVNRDIARLTEQDTFDIAISIDQLFAGHNLLGKTEFGLVAAKGDLQLKPVKISGPGGHIDLEFGGGPTADGVAAQLNAKVQKLEYDGLLRLLDSTSEDSGTLFLKSSLASSAPDWSQIYSGINGTLDVAVFPRDIEAGFLDLWASNLILAVLPAPKNSGKQMNCMVARMDIENGIMTSTNTFLDSTDVIVRARGTIDLGQRQLDLLVVPQAKSEKFFSASAPLQVTGPLDDFIVEVAPGELLVTLVRWYYSLIYVPWKWVSGERFPADGIVTCYKAFDLEPPAEGEQSDTTR